MNEVEYHENFGQWVAHCVTDDPILPSIDLDIEASDMGEAWEKAEQMTMAGNYYPRSVTVKE